MYERLTLNWAPSSIMGWSDGKRMIHYIDGGDEMYSVLDDISVKMKQRAKNAYGLKANFADNGDIVEDDATLKNMWYWLDFCKNLTEKEKYRLPSIGSITFPGALTVLNIDSSNGESSLKSEIINNSSFDLRNSKTYRFAQISLTSRVKISRSLNLLFFDL